MPVLLAGAAATTFGVADFLGGTAARRVPAAVVALLAQLTGLALLLLALTLLSAPALPAAMGWGALAGAAGGIGVPVLYRGLARGPMNVVAPLAALTSAAVPVLAGALLGERPSAPAWVGIGLAVVAAVVVGAGVPAESSVDGDSGSGGAGARAGVLGGAALALFAGLCFGGFFVLIAQAEPAAGLWPVAAAKASGSLVAAVGLLIALRMGALAAGATASPGVEPGATASPGVEPGADRPGVRPVRARGWRMAAAGGGLDALANVFYLLAAQRGQLAVVGAIVALYPASTVLLARVLHGEPIARTQRLGLALAVPALILVGAG